MYITPLFFHANKLNIVLNKKNFVLFLKENDPKFGEINCVIYPNIIKKMMGDSPQISMKKTQEIAQNHERFHFIRTLYCTH